MDKEKTLVLLGILLGHPSEWTMEQVTELQEHKEELRELLYDMSGRCGAIEGTTQHFQLMEELGKLSTEELQARQDEISREWNRIAAADTSDDLDDSFFEGPRIGSTEYALGKILKERRGEEKVAN